MTENEKEIKRGIVDILQMTFDVIDRCYGVNDELQSKADYKNTNTRLIFPCRYKVENNKPEKLETRVSEQELRFLFIEQFNQYCQNSKNDLWKNAYYSIETPTEWSYKFSETTEQQKDEKKVPHKVEQVKEDEKGQSAMIDVCIHDDTGKRICIIEFKYGNPEKFCFEKDLVKLEKEEKLSFFVHLLKSQRSDTLGCVLWKVETVPIKKDSGEIVYDQIAFDKINYICHTFPKNEDRKGKTQYITNDSEIFNEKNDWDRLDLLSDDIQKQIKDYQNKRDNKKQ